MSNGFCTNHCGGYAFAIVQGKTCSCSNTAPASTDDGDCSSPCPGYPSDKCGGEGTFGYIQLGQPHGTAGAMNSQPTGSGSGSGSSGSGGSSVNSPPIAQTVVQTEQSVQVSTQIQTETNLVVSTQEVCCPSPSSHSNWKGISTNFEPRAY